MRKILEAAPYDLTGGAFALAEAPRRHTGVLDDLREGPPPASANITGTAAGETLNGTASGDTIRGLGGGDTINGGDGNDNLYADNYGFDNGVEVDFLNGQNGNDYLFGGVGDVFDGGAGFDVAKLHLRTSTVGVHIDLAQSAAGIAQSTGSGSIVNIEGIWLYGGSGEDWVITGSTQDTLRGGEGNDTLSSLGGGDHLFGEGGDDNLSGGDSGDDIFGDAAGEIVTGGSDILNGDAGNDFIHGGGGDDLVFGGADNDRLYGEGGSDDLQGGSGDDEIDGGADLVMDILSGGDGSDNLIGLANDVFDGGAGVSDGLELDLSTSSASHSIDIGLAAAGMVQSIQGGGSFVNIESGRIFFGSGNDVFAGDTIFRGEYSQADVVFGGDGDDVISGNLDHDNLNGDGGNDTLLGGAGQDRLHGGDGDDLMRGGADEDYMYGGDGSDTIEYSDAASGVTVSLLLTTQLQDTGGGGVDWIDEVENLRGSSFADALTGDSGANRLEGLSGSDTINGGDGNDAITGGTGNDTLDGGAGHDTFNFAAGDGVDTITGFTAGGTDDTLVVTGFASYTLSQEGADLRVILDGSNSILLTNTLAANFTAADINIPLGGGFNVIDGTAGPDDLDGTAGADQINGLAGDDILSGAGDNDELNGGDDNDTLIGGGGNDLLLGGAGADTFRFEAGLFGNDTVTDFANGVDLIQLTGIAGVDDFSDLVVSANGGNALITLPDGSTITLNGVSDGLVDASDFVFGG